MGGGGAYIYIYMGGGGGYNHIFCLLVDGPITRGAQKWGGGREGYEGQLTVVYFCWKLPCLPGIPLTVNAPTLQIYYKLLFKQ